MGRIRRRRRWIAAVQGAAATVALAGPLLVAITIVLPRTAGVTIDVRQLAVALLLAAGIGAGARAARRISLHSCARAVDRALGAERSGDCVLAAVALGETSSAPTAFVAAVTTDAAARARQVAPKRAVPPPSPRSLVLAAAAIGLVLAVGLLPVARSRASTAPKSRAKGSAPTNNPVLPIQLPGAALDAEREDVRRATVAAREAADRELAALARRFEALLSDLSHRGLDAGAAVARLSNLVDDAQSVTDESVAAKAAARAGAGVLATARGVGTDGAAFAAEIGKMPAKVPGASEAAGQAAERLAARGETGRATLARAAQAAAAALAAGGAGSGVGPGTNNRDGDGSVEHRRRLDHQSESPGSTKDLPAGDGARNPQRRLQQLRRDLEQAGANCATNPDTCRRNADQTGRALADLHRQGRTAEARQRLAEAARQLLDRIRRGGAVSGEREQLRRFAKAARGAGRGDTGAADPNPANRGEQGGAESPGGGGIPLTETAGEDGDGDSGPQFASPSDSEGGAPPPTTAGSSEGSGNAVAGSGIGAEPGGPVLGSRSPAGTAAGRDTPAQVRDDPAGSSRAAIIGGAAAGGFASAEYRRVFDDYHTAVEESLDATVVPPGRRYLVRRYFQLIRPRTP